MRLFIRPSNCLFFSLLLDELIACCKARSLCMHALPKATCCETRSVCMHASGHALGKSQAAAEDVAGMAKSPAAAEDVAMQREVLTNSILPKVEGGLHEHV